jgi:tellurite resistance protein TerB
MPRRLQEKYPYMRDYLHDLHGEVAEQLFASVVAGCAIIAYADGWVTPKERDRLKTAIRSFGDLATFSTDELTYAFDATLEKFEHDHEQAERDCMAIIKKFGGKSQDAAMLVRLCCDIASADGAFDAEEREAALRICKALGLPAADFDLLAA